MPVSNLADVQSFNEYARRKVLKRVESCPPELLVWRPAPDRWSILEHLEHLTYSELFLTAEARRLAAELRRRGHTAPADAPRSVDATPALAAVGALTRAFVAPEYSQPRGKSKEEVLTMLAASRAESLAVLQELAELDTDRLTAPHLSGADFNAVQFVHFIGLHEWLHEGHMAKNAAAWAQAQADR